jgi:hypothetical protein
VLTQAPVSENGDAQQNNRTKDSRHKLKNGGRQRCGQPVPLPVPFARNAQRNDGADDEAHLDHRSGHQADNEKTLFMHRSAATSMGRQSQQSSRRPKNIHQARWLLRQTGTTTAFEGQEV